MDPAKLKAMAEAMKRLPPAEAAKQMKQLMNQMVPGASQMVAAAKNNFKFAIPDGKGCTVGTGRPFLAQCDISRTVTVAAPRTMAVAGGQAAAQTITEKTTITIGKPSAAKP